MHTQRFGPVKQWGFVVRDIDAAMKSWVEQLGIGPWWGYRNVPLKSSFHGVEADIQLDVALSYQNGVQIELIQQKNDAVSPHMENLIMPLTQEQFVALAHRHNQAEADADLEGTLATLEAEPAYYFYPAGRKFTGMAAARRFYENFIKNFKPRIRNVEFHGEAIGVGGVSQEYTITLECDDGQVRDYRIIGVLVFGESALNGERMYADEALFRLLAGSLWDEMLPS